MNVNRLRELPLLLVAAVLFFLSACTGEPKDLGLGVLPPSDTVGVVFTDTVTINFESRRIDQTYSFRGLRQLMGNYTDPEFGHITAEAFFQVIPESGLDFGPADSLSFDSLVLNLEIDAFYGRLTSPQTLRVYEMTESLPDSADFESDRRLASDKSKDLASGYTIDFSAAGEVGLTSIRLDDELGQRLLFANPDTLGDITLFDNLFKGFHLLTDSVAFLNREPGAIYSLFLNDNDSELILYYRRQNQSGVFERRVQSFVIGPAARKYHYLRRTNWEFRTLLGQHLAPGQPDSDDLFEFNQGALLITNLIEFPHIRGLGQVATNKAELILKGVPDALGSELRYIPPELRIIQADENGEEKRDEDGNLIALQPGSTATYRYNLEVGGYRIPLTDYVQQLLAGDRDDNRFIITSTNREVLINRVVFGGTAHPELAPELKITYTTLPN